MTSDRILKARVKNFLFGNGYWDLRLLKILNSQNGVNNQRNRQGIPIITVS
jgi:hypothetical protein